MDTTGTRCDAEGAVRTALVGLGAIGRIHASIVGQNPIAELVGMVDEIPHRSSYGVPSFDSVGALLDGVEPDLLIVATPPASHEGIVDEALRRGVHVLCEKPLALDAQQADRLATAAESVPSVTAVNLQLRYDVVLRRLRELLSAGAIGRPLFASVRINVDRVLDAAWHWTHDVRQGGGVVMEFGTHYLDVLRWLLGPLEVSSATARTLITPRLRQDGRPAPVTSEDWAQASLLAAGELPVSMEIAPTWDPRTGRELVVVGTEGSLRADIGVLHLRESSGRSHDVTPEGYDIENWVAGSMAALFQDLCSHLREPMTGNGPGAGEWATFREAAEIQRLVDRIRLRPSGEENR